MPPNKCEYLLYFVDIAVTFILNIAIEKTIISSIRKNIIYKIVYKRPEVVIHD